MNTQYNLLSQYFCLVLFVFASIFLTSCSRSAARKHIVVIQSYEANYPYYKEVENQIASYLASKNIRADIYLLNLESGQYSEKQQRLRLYKALDSLIQWKPDLMIVNDDPALNALLMGKHPLIDSLPIIFSGVNYPDLSSIRKRPNITGFYDKPDYKANIKLIERLVGKSIVVRVTNESYMDKLILSDMDEQLKGICLINNIFSEDRVRMSGQTGLSLSSVPKIKPDTMYLSTVNIKSTRSLVKGLGENYYNKAYLATKRDYMTLTLGRFCSFPSFSVVNELIGYDNGVIGGYVTPLEAQTQQMLERAVEVLTGTPVENFPQIVESNKKYVFDYRVLKQWNIAKSLLPADALFVNMPLFVRYRPYFIFLISIGGILFIGVIFYLNIKYQREARYKREIQKKLEQEKEFLSFALESGNIFTFRYKQGIFEFDKEFFHSLGIPPERISATRFQAAIHSDEQEDFIKNRYKLDHGFLSRQVTRRRYDFNGKGHQWWEFRYAQNKNMHASSESDVVEVSGLCLNIQQIKENEDNLKIAIQKAEESDRMKSVFLANMSHEIRTPLNAIVGFSQLLNSDIELEPEEKAEFIDLISKNSDLLLKLINDILDLSRIESGRLSFAFEDCNLNELITDIFHTHQRMMPENVELRMQIPEIPAVIYTDKGRLTQVCTNFINNARKFTSRGYIEIKYDYSPDERFVFISVKDTGKGIPEDKKALVFERFQKLDEFAQGTGLGLAICQSIINAFKGTIHLESEEGKGSCFTITLPYTPYIKTSEN